MAAPAYGTHLKPLTKAERRNMRRHHAVTLTPRVLTIDDVPPQRTDAQKRASTIVVLFHGEPPRPGAKAHKMRGIAKALLEYTSSPETSGTPPLNLARILNELIALSRKATSDLPTTTQAERVAAARRIAQGFVCIEAVSGAGGVGVALDIAIPNLAMRDEINAILQAAADREAAVAAGKVDALSDSIVAKWTLV